MRFDWSKGAFVEGDDACEAAPDTAFDGWLGDLEGPSPHPVEIEQMHDLNAPLVATWWREHQQDEQDAQRDRLAAELEGPYAEVWRYHEGIQAEIERLSAAARDTIGTDRESNVRQLRDAEADLVKFRATPEFCAAVAFMLGRMDALDSAIARAGEDVTPEKAAARGWYHAHRGRMAALLAEQAIAASAGAVQGPHEPTPQTESAREHGVEPVGDGARDHDARLAALFDPVKVATLEALFPSGAAWGKYVERASRNGLIGARAGRGRFNPFVAARWWLDTQAPPGWKWERCIRVLANNLPARSRDSRHLLTGDFD